MDYQPIIDAAIAAGKIIKQYFGEALETEGKSRPSDFRTKADLESEDIIIKAIEKCYPSYNILSEERGFIDRKSKYCFIIDPLDGTNNFSIGLPNLTVSIALQKDNKTVFGVIYQPITQQVFHAEKGKGAWLDGSKITVNSETDIHNVTLAMAVGYIKRLDFLNQTMESCYRLKYKRFMNNWSVAYDFCMLALGRIEAMIVYDTEIHDFAAGKLIAEEAGAKVTRFDGQNSPDTDLRFVVTNGTAIHQNILNLAQDLK